MQRFYVAQPLSGGEVRLPGHVARQVSTVLRMKEGDRLVLFDGSGPEWLGELVSAGKSAAVRLVERRPAPAAPRRRVTLCQAVLKGERMEWVLQKATELGVTRFQPVLTERVVAQKQDVPERWRRIVMEAAEQSGRTDLPTLSVPVGLEQALSHPGTRVMCWESERDLTLWRWLADSAPDALALFIGPEGGFSEREAGLARDRGAALVSLGPRVLRAETAAVAASALALLAP